MQKYIFILIAGLFLSSSILTSAGCAQKKGADTGGASSSEGGGDEGGDSGGGGMTTQGNFRIIFVTTTEVNGSGVASGLGSGLTSLDALCESEKVTKGFGGTFKALVGAGQRKPNGTDWVLRTGKEYRREDLTTIIDIAEHNVTAGGPIFPYVDSALTNTITAVDKYPWTGFGSDWTIDSSNCSDWTRNDYDGTTATLAIYGKSSINEELVETDFSSWMGSFLLYNHDFMKNRCNQLHPVYCVQTKQLPPPGDYKVLFMSTTTVRGDAGIGAMDSACAADATTKGLTGTYKAVVVGNDAVSGNPVRRVCSAANCTGATGTEQSVDWTLLPDMHYRRDDRVTYVGKTNEHGYFEAELEEPIASSGNYWSGMTNTLATSALFQHCGGWQEPTFNGFVNSAAGYTPAYGTSSVLCSTALSVLCAEQ